MNEGDLLRLWGKSDPEDTSNYHPLAFHLLDVGHAALLLWREVIPERVRQRFAQAFGLDGEQTERVVVLLAAQHDLGKASAFQLKPSVPELAGQVRAAGYTIEPVNEKPHGYVTTKALPDFAARGVGGWQAIRPTAHLLAKIVGGHHGTFPTDRELTEIGCLAMGDGRWDEARAALLETVQGVLFPGKPTANIAGRLRDAALLPLLGGFVSVADWIGSSKEHFKPAGPVPLDVYGPQSLAHARQALADFGWAPVPRFASAAEFGELFHDANGQAFRPNPMQAEVIRRVDAAPEPYLLLVEAAMGEGKTEAAFYAVDRALSTGLAHGFFVGLPTQATGNAMFERTLNDYLKRRGHGGNLDFQLIHSGNFLSDTFDKLRFAANSKRGDDRESRVVAQSWFTHKKQALLAPFGVGTIDQSLLSVLQTRHWFVRLFGLAGKVVVFDEVHAYDVYMSALLGRLLGWLRLLGCTVVLLSATLPQTNRRELIKAWNPEADVAPAAYPRVTFVGGEGATAATVTQNKEPKRIAVAYAEPDFAALIQRVREDLPGGGCAAVICNTVARAQEAYTLFCDALGKEGWDVSLFHARTLAKWRQETENEVLNKFGKKGARPTKAVLIATQVAEQSLDLDFDWMASEMAPVDLLLQRVGRLWRHERPNRPVGAPNFVILCGEEESGLPRFPPYSDLVYEPFVLLRSRLALAPGTLTLPNDIEPLIRAVYDELTPAGLSEAWQAALTATEAKMRERAEQDTEKAERCLVKPCHRSASDVLEIGSEAGDVRLELSDAEDPRVHDSVRAATRLGDPSVAVVCCGTDADDQPLAPEPSGVPSPKDARELLGFAVSLSSRGLYRTLAAMDPPKPWQESPFVRWHRALTFENGLCRLEGYTLRLSEAEGLVIEKAGRKTEE